LLQLGGQEFHSQLDLAKTLQIGTVALLPGARCAEELQGTHPENTKMREMKPEIVQTQSWCYKIIVVIKHQEQHHHIIKSLAHQAGPRTLSEM